MKKTIIIVSAIILTVTATILVLEYVVFKRTPENALKVHFKMSLKDFDYTVEAFREQWCQNGDGKSFAIYKFNELTEKIPVAI